MQPPERICCYSRLSVRAKEFVTRGRLCAPRGIRKWEQINWETAGQVIVFHLVPAEDNSQESLPTLTATLDELRRMTYKASRDVAERSTREARQSYYKRSAAVKAYVLARAAGICEACKRPAPFRRLDQSHYLEPHHTRRVSDGGPDGPRCVAGICPNCHREIHHGVTAKELNKKLELYLRGIE